MPAEVEYAENPKMIGSGMLACCPQRGKCFGGGETWPEPCSECYHNAPGCYRDISVPNIPPPSMTPGKLIRMNDGNDSNHERDLVLETARKMMQSPYNAKGVFYNTSIPKLDFPGPVVFTANGRMPLFVDCPPNLMAVRVRLASWEVESAFEMVRHYRKRSIPVILTAMRYRTKEAMPPRIRELNYVHKTHILNEYWCITPERLEAIREDMDMCLGKQGGVLVCGGLCRECGNCARLYDQCVARMVEARIQEGGAQ